MTLDNYSVFNDDYLNQPSSRQLSPVSKMLVPVDGIQSGVPTLTTSTLTPTTLRSIEETFTQLVSEPINAPYQAGFIPPPLATFSTAITNTSPTAATATTAYKTIIQDFNETYETESENSQASWNAAVHLNEDHSMAATDTSSAATDTNSFQNGLSRIGYTSLATSTTSRKTDFTSVNIAIAAAAVAVAKNSSGCGVIINNNKIPKNDSTSNSATHTKPRRNQGGRRPVKAANITPEEEEKRRIRRERNKLAAARCRKRRVDQTNDLMDEVDLLEKKREDLRKDIETLNTTKKELQYILEAHRASCQKLRQDILTVSTYSALIVPRRSHDDIISVNTISKIDTTLSATGRIHSPIDLKPVLPETMLDVAQKIKHEPIDDSALDSNSSLHLEDTSSPKPILLIRNNPMIPPALPNLATSATSLNASMISTAPAILGTFNSSTTLNALNTGSKPAYQSGIKQRPNTLPNLPRNSLQTLGLSVNGKPPTDINGVAIQTPSTGMFNFDSLMDGGTGLTPVSGPLVPNCSSQNKHPLEITTPTSESSKLVCL